jgi:hypothetical protein
VKQPTVEITYARIEEAEDSCTRQKCPPAPWGARLRYAHVNLSCKLIEQYASGGLRMKVRSVPLFRTIGFRPNGSHGTDLWASHREHPLCRYAPEAPRQTSTSLSSSHAPSWRPDAPGAPLLCDLMRRRPQHFYAFDLLWPDGQDVGDRPLLELSSRRCRSHGHRRVDL